jgi:hypothetical protein
MDGAMANFEWNGVEIQTARWVRMGSGEGSQNVPVQLFSPIVALIPLDLSDLLPKHGPGVL